MATLSADKLGILNINLIQGANKTITLKFESKDGEIITPIDLTQYDEIKMDVKTAVDVNETAFITFDLTDGLTISGVDNNLLSFSFAQEFYSSQRTEWFYDIRFDKVGVLSYMIKGVIKVDKRVTA